MGDPFCVDASVSTGVGTTQEANNGGEHPAVVASSADVNLVVGCRSSDVGFIKAGPQVMSLTSPTPYPGSAWLIGGDLKLGLRLPETSISGSASASILSVQKEGSAVYVMTTLGVDYRLPYISIGVFGGIFGGVPGDPIIGGLHLTLNGLGLDGFKK